jgi:hypothetical protein
MKKKTSSNFPFNKSRLRSAIRKEWMWCELKKQALTRARVARGLYQCEKCAAQVSNKEIEIDHIVKVTPPQGLQTGQDWGTFIHNMFYCGLDGVIALCDKCHEEKSKLEREIVKQYKKKQKEKK